MPRLRPEHCQTGFNCPVPLSPPSQFSDLWDIPLRCSQPLSAGGLLLSLSTAQSPQTHFPVCLRSFGFFSDRHRQKRGLCIEVCIQSILTFARGHARSFPERHRGSKCGPAQVGNLGTGCAGCIAQSRVEQVLGKWESQSYLMTDDQ